MGGNDSSSSGGFLMKTGIFAALAGVAYFLFQFFGGSKNEAENAPPIKPQKPKTEQKTESEKPQTPASEFEISASDPSIYEPTRSKNAQHVRHKWFSLSYSEDHEQAEWVAYELTRERLNANFVDRTNDFRPDPDVKTESATPADYRGSGFDRGHLCPAADMGFDQTAMAETFFMSNMSPQKKAFNTGIWRELEENVRDWARKRRHVYVVTGPVLTVKTAGPIGFSKVTVPGYFYKVILAGDTGIGFLVPNEKTERPLMDFAVPIDQVERVTGLDFFPNLLTGLQEEAEAKLDKPAWKTDEARFARRVEVWNLEK